MANSSLWVRGARNPSSRSIRPPNPAVIGHRVAATAIGVAAAEVRQWDGGHDRAQRVAKHLVGSAVDCEVRAVPPASVIEVGGIVAEPPQEMVEGSVLHHDHQDGVDGALRRRVVEDAGRPGGVPTSGVPGVVGPAVISAAGKDQAAQRGRASSAAPAIRRNSRRSISLTVRCHARARRRPSPRSQPVGVVARSHVGPRHQVRHVRQQHAMHHGLHGYTPSR
jgi:hypothetical protein